MILQFTANSIEVQEAESYLHWLAAMFPHLQDKEQLLEQMKGLRSLAHSLRWMLPVSPVSPGKIADVEALVKILNQKIAEKQNRRKE